MYLQLLSTLWTCSSLRPFMVTEDEYLQEMISFSSSVNGALKLPSCNLNRKNIMIVHMWMKQHIKDIMQKLMLYVTCTSDIWSSKNMRSSSKWKELLSKIQVLQSIENLLLVKQDVQTRWSSTYHMLKQMERLMGGIILFESFYQSSAGKKEFTGRKGTFPELHQEKWALMKGLRC
jgi:hypothetical protein